MTYVFSYALMGGCPAPIPLRDRPAGLTEPLAGLPECAVDANIEPHNSDKCDGEFTSPDMGLYPCVLCRNAKTGAWLGNCVIKSLGVFCVVGDCVVDGRCSKRSGAVGSERPKR